MRTCECWGDTIQSITPVSQNEINYQEGDPESQELEN